MRTLLVASGLFLSTTLFAQIDTAKFKLAAKAQAETFWNHFKGNDFDAAVKFLHPKYIQFRGGKDSLIAEIKEGIVEMGESGYTVASITTGEPGEIFKQGKEYQCLIPTTMVIDILVAKIGAKSSIVAISENGKNWKYVMVDGEELEKLRKAVNIHDSIELKETQAEMKPE